MKRLLLGLFLLVLYGAEAAPNKAVTVIHGEIDRLVALYTDGFGYNQPKWRHVMFGPIFSPDSKDAVAFFTLAGVSLMNGYEQYIAVFAQGQGRSIGGADNDFKTPITKERPFRLVATAQIGTRWVRTLDWETAKISQGRIVVQGLRWGSDDAGCCPTQPIEVTFSVSTAEGRETQYPLLRQDEKPGKQQATESPRR